MHHISNLTQHLANTDGFNTDASVSDTISRMIDIVYSESGHPIILLAIQEATAQLGNSASDTEIAEAIYYWTKRRIKFTEDEEILYRQLGFDSLDAVDTELLITPTALLSLDTPVGDCDDFSTLLVAMFHTLKYKCWFVTIAADSNFPEKFSHVYCKVWLQDIGRALYLDASHGSFPGWEYEGASRKEEWIV